MPNLKSLASAIAEILLGTIKFRGTPLARRHTHFFGWDFMTGFGKPQDHAKYKVADFICYGNIR